jgi:hypothetical protein
MKILGKTLAGIAVLAVVLVSVARKTLRDLSG